MAKDIKRIIDTKIENSLNRKNERTRESRIDRKKRTPLGVPFLKMEASSKKGKVRRWINDTGNRIQRALNASYTFVKNEDNIKVGEGLENNNTNLGDCISMLAGDQKNGEPMHAYLMEIDEDLYKEDQMIKQREIDKTEEAIKRGQFENKLGNKGYIPSEGISLSHGVNS